MDLKTNDKLIKIMCLSLGLVLMAAAAISSTFSGGLEGILWGWREILLSPCPLITDYFGIGGVAATFFNAGVCSLSCLALTVFYRAKVNSSYLAAYLLLVAHCFYGMNFLNIWPCYIGVILYYCHKKKDFREHLHIAMFSMAFGPLVSEVLLRYPIKTEILVGDIQINLVRIVATIFIGLAAGMVLPGMLEGALWMHKGYNLYNGGLAFGLVGGLLYAFLYKTMGLESSGPVVLNNRFYDGVGESNWLFANLVFIFIFGLALIAGYVLNGKSFKGYGSLIQETGHQSNFADKYGMPLCFINFGIYGFMVLGYMNLIMVLTEGVAFTGPTVGAIFAAVTFAAVGQHPKNTWPIFAGYAVLSVFVTVMCGLYGQEAPCTLSTNGGFSAGITALILIPILEHHFPHMKVKS